MGALRKRLGAVRPEKGKVIGEARVEVEIFGAETRRWPESVFGDATLWVLLAGWAGVEAVEVSYSILGDGVGLGNSRLLGCV